MRYYIIDDNMGVVKTLRNIIISREIGSVCGYAVDPRDALDEILQLSPDIVLVDLLMDKIDGISLVSKIKHTDPMIKFVMISKVSDKPMVQDAYSAGIEFFINKPVNVIEVERVLDNVSRDIKMRKIMENINAVFEGEDAFGIFPTNEQRNNISCFIENADMLLAMLGMLGEKGTYDIKLLLSCMERVNSGFSKDIIKMAAEIENDTEKNIEQRTRRAIRKGLINAANAGIMDTDSDAYSIYAAYVFDFNCLRDEIEYQEGRSKSGGKINTAHFMEGLMLYCNSLNNK